MSMYLVSGTSIQILKKMLIKSKQENKRKPHKLLYYQYSPPPLFAASISAVWNIVLGQGLGTKLSESQITENTMVGLLFPSLETFLVDTFCLISFHVYSTSFAFIYKYAWWNWLCQQCKRWYFLLRCDVTTIQYHMMQYYILELYTTEL